MWALLERMLVQGKSKRQVVLPSLNGSAWAQFLCSRSKTSAFEHLSPRILVRRELFRRWPYGLISQYH